MLEDLLIAVPGGVDTVDAVIARLEELGLVGWAIDGARLGHDGWVIARVAADEDGALASDDDDVLQLLEIGDLRAALVQTWPQAQIDDVVIAGHDVVPPLCQSPETPLHEVAVATARGMGLDMEASLEKLTLAEVRLGKKMIFARVQPIVGLEHELVDVFTTAKGGSVVLWRRDPYLVLQVLGRSKEVDLHVWGPRWAAVGAEAHDDVRFMLRPVDGDAAEIVKVLDLPTDSVVQLRALMRRETPSLDQLCELLGLPEEALRVISGDCGVEDLPGAVIHEPTKFTTVVRAAMRPSDDDPAWVQWIERGSRELRPWYVVSSLLTMVLGVWMVAEWRSGGSGFWGVLGLVMALGTAIDLPVRWWRRRRRMAS